MTMTSTTYGAEYGATSQTNGIHAYIDGGDYTDEQTKELVESLMETLRACVDERLPDGIWWSLETSEFIHPVGADMPDRETVAGIFTASWAEVESVFDELERRVLHPYGECDCSNPACQV